MTTRSDGATDKFLSGYNCAQSVLWSFSEHVDDHAFEELYLLPLVFALYTAPTVLFSTIGFGRLANRFYRRGKVAA